MIISVPRDSGNIEVRDQSDPGSVRLAISSDAGSTHRQWFHYRASDVRGVPLVMRIENASACSYPNAWRGYQACASADGVTWERVPTSFDGTTLEIRHTPVSDVCWYAYFAPYPMQRHLERVAAWSLLDGVRLRRLGATLDEQDLDLLQIEASGVPASPTRPTDGRPTIWVLARQHPGETMAEWFVEGMLDRLLDPDDALARRLRAKAVWYVVPNMNPDGSHRGHLRTNAAGANLNREWASPSLERSPEVALVLDCMDRTGVDLCLDVHGDEELPYNFVSGAEGIPSWDDRLAELQQRFLQRWVTDNPDFQTAHGYPVAAPGEANLTMCTNQVAERFGCLAMTIEQPFKDAADTPVPRTGWSPGRARRLGASVLGAIDRVLDGLR